MGLVPYIQAALTLTLAVATIVMAAALRSMGTTLRDLLAALRKHGGRYSDPSAAAVVVPSPRPAPVEVGPEPELARALERAMLPEAAPAEAARAGGRVVRGPWAGSGGKGDGEAEAMGRAAIPPGMGGALGVSEVAVWVGMEAEEAPPASESRAIPLEEVAKLDEATIAQIDALAEERGVTREAMILALIEAGAEEVQQLVAGRTTPAGGPAGDGGPPSGLRRQ